MEEIAYVDGQYLPIKEATVSIHDRGFLFGDGVYELVRICSGRPFTLDRHLARLRKSREAIRLDSPIGDDDLVRLIEEGAQRSGLGDADVYIEITRGVAPRRHSFPQGTPPTLVVTFRHAQIIADSVRQKGVRAVFVPDNRWGRCDIKSINLLPNLLAKQAARDRGAWEAIFLSEDDGLSEAASTNIFLVLEGRLVTPREGPRLLSGVTREILLERARAVGIPAAEQELRRSDLLAAEEVFLAGTTTEVLAIVACDDTPIGAGKPGPNTLLLHRELRYLMGGGAGTAGFPGN